ncbi:hypothetical protein [Streptomyces noursei]|uniref:hypothetical protein n=1 Tax=Streptomyces noursei TaxID=1971 RepID=UPI00167B7196|nr:hypothetical protein [Streptomyces noursei]MCZ1021105.1 hypothetical protein [Streptomyces noursei]MCZ1021136.1 hypothetical protein [Streptomyces noursei]MCZ1021469.1 hypothetical protein [Streptomyces noursei]GGX51470.1 hypothetical protein GCM10010341_86220 [Streptomyces noursei]
MHDTAVAGFGLPAWDDFVLEMSEDAAKRDLELRHRPCGAHLCDAQDGDSIGVLILLVAEHAAACPRC